MIADSDRQGSMEVMNGCRVCWEQTRTVCMKRKVLLRRIGQINLNVSTNQNNTTLIISNVWIAFYGAVTSLLNVF